MFPCVALALPGLVTGLARSRDGVKSPGFAARAGVISCNEPANTKLSPGHANDDLVLDHERRNRQCITGTRIRNPGIPDRPACLGVKRDEMRIESCEKQGVTKDRQPAIYGSTAGPRVGRRIVTVNPEHASCFCIECKCITRSLSNVHDSIDHERRRFKLFQRLRLKDPLLLEAL